MSVMMAWHGDVDYRSGHDISSREEPMYSDGVLTVNASYTGILGDCEKMDWNDTWGSGYHSDKWTVPYVRGEDGVFSIADEEMARRMEPINLDNPAFNMYSSIPRAGLWVMFPNAGRDIRENGSAAAKKWLDKDLMPVGQR